MWDLWGYELLFKIHPVFIQCLSCLFSNRTQPVGAIPMTPMQKARDALAALPECTAASRQTGEPCKPLGSGAGGNCRPHGGVPTGRPSKHPAVRLHGCQSHHGACTAPTFAIGLDESLEMRFQDANSYRPSSSRSSSSSTWQ